MPHAKLFYNDKGRLLQRRHEEIGERAWIRKFFSIDLDRPGASTLSIFTLEYPGNPYPLRVEVNGTPYTMAPDPARQRFFAWRTLELPEGAVKRGLNEVRISSDNRIFNHWIVGVDNGNISGTSFKSFDQGQTWLSERIGYDYSLRGEYMIRWYIEERGDRPVTEEPIRQVLQPLDHPDLKQYRDMERLDEVTAGAPADYEKAKKLCSWVSRQWVHGPGRIYPPIHFPTLLHWERNGSGHGSDEGVLGFCVIFAQALMQACWAMGMQARHIVLPTFTDEEPAGHSIMEVYCRELGKWVMFDPDYDIHMLDGDSPLNVGEMSEYWIRGEIGKVAVSRGPSFGHSHTDTDYAEAHLRSGYQSFATHCYQDYVSRPDHQMMNHGRVFGLHYYEPELIWYDRSLALKKQYPLVTDRLELLYGKPEGA